MPRADPCLFSHVLAEGATSATLDRIAERLALTTDEKLGAVLSGRVSTGLLVRLIDMLTPTVEVGVREKVVGVLNDITKRVRESGCKELPVVSGASHVRTTPGSPSTHAAHAFCK